MKKILVALILAGLLTAVATAPQAANDTVFYLKDGSIVRGEVISHYSRVYSVKTDGLGTVRIHETKIASKQDAAPAAVHSATPSSQSPSAASAGSNSLGAQTQALQKQMLADPDIMNMIFSLSDDPDMQRVLADPAVLEAVSTGDLDALVNNPDFIKLLSNPKIQEISRETAR